LQIAHGFVARQAQGPERAAEIVEQAECGLARDLLLVELDQQPEVVGGRPQRGDGDRIVRLLESVRLLVRPCR
jgi:hypothetical protein